MLNSYLNLEKDEHTGKYHPLLTGFEDATRIINGVNQLAVKKIGTDVSSPLQVIPTYPDLPMEEVFPRPAKDHQSGVFLREMGRGRVVYFPADIDRTFWEVLDVDHAMLLRNAVLWATDEPSPVTVEGKGVLDISVWTQKKSMTVHLVNLTNPMMMKGPLREVIPLARQKVHVQVPKGRRVTRVRLLVAEQEVRHTVEGDGVVVEVASIGIHEVVAFDLA